MAHFPFTEVKSLTQWTNYSGSLGSFSVPSYCTLDAPHRVEAGAPPRLRRGAEAISAILDHCWRTPDLTCRTVGSTWSFSTLLSPGSLVVDAGNLNEMSTVRPEWLAQDYRVRRPHFTPVFVQGGTQIASINRRLLDANLALQTSGAADGQRIAGCIATGTHGSALSVGAVHDTVLGIHLITAPEQSVLVQPSAPCCGPHFAAWLEEATGVPVRAVNDDEVFAATQVALGSLGFVHGVILETEPLYALRGHVLNLDRDDPRLWQAMQTLDTTALHPEHETQSPFHFEVVFNPYPRTGSPGAFVKLFWKAPAFHAPRKHPTAGPIEISSELMGIVSSLSEALDGPVSTRLIELVMGEQLERRYRPGRRTAQLPGSVWGPTTLPPGRGASTEVTVGREHVQKTLKLFFELLAEERDHGRHLLGPIGVRFIPQGGALLGLNAPGPVACIELPSIRTDEVLTIFQRFWDQLAGQGIPFGCHWGQQHGMDAQRLERYLGERPARWRAVRDDLLDSEGRRVFASPLLAEVGLMHTD